MLSCLKTCFKRHETAQNNSQKYSSTETDGFDSEYINLKLQPQNSSNSLNLLLSSLTSHQLFKHLPESVLAASLNVFKFFIVEPDKTIIAQSETPKLFFVIHSGKCTKTIEKKVKSDISAGSTFGEYYLLGHEESLYSVKTITKCCFWGLTRADYKKILLKLEDVYKNAFIQISSKSILLKELSRNAVSQIFKFSVVGQFEKNETVCNKGLDNCFLFIVISGKICAFADGNIIESFEEGQMFGENKLFKLEPGKTKLIYKSQERSKVFIINLKEMVSGLDRDYQEMFLRNICLTALKTDKSFRNLPLEFINSIAKSFKFSKFPLGSAVFEDKTSSSLKVLCIGKVAAKNNSFSNCSLIGLQNKNHLKLGTGNYLCLKETIIAEVPISYLNKQLNTDLPSRIISLQTASYIQSIRFFHKFPLSDLENLIKVVQRKEYQKDTFVFQEFQISDKLFLIEQGSVGIFQGNEFVFRYDKGAVFGETCLFLNTREHSAKALTNLKCLEFSREDVKKSMSQEIAEEISRCFYYTGRVELDDLALLGLKRESIDRDLYISKSLSNGYKYLTEIVYKKKVHKYNEFQFILNQKCVVSQLNHPHIPRLIRSLSDRDCIFFLFDYKPFEYLSNFINALPVKAVKFIFLGILCGLHYIHAKNILHRDLNPSNIALDEKGYAKILGFKYSKECFRSYSVLTTDIEYKDKHVILGKCYDRTSDLWSCGIMLYEMATGKLPFGFDKNDGYSEKLEKIVGFQIGSKPDIISDDCWEIIKGMLNEDHTKRLTISQISKSKWGKEYDFKDIFHENYKPVFKPSIKEVSEVDKVRMYSVERRLTAEDKRNRAKISWDSYF